VEIFVAEYNSQNGKQGGRIAFRPPIKNGNEFLIAISTSLMSRVRKHYKEDAKMLFIDSTGSVDAHELVVTLVVVATCAGALPMGITIAGSKSEETYTQAFDLLKMLTEEIDPTTSMQPNIGMTDHDESIRNSLKSVWPNITLFLCLFHILQAVWRHLMLSASGVAKDDRQAVFRAFRTCVYANKSDLNSSKDALFSLGSLSEQCREYFNGL